MTNRRPDSNAFSTTETAGGSLLAGDRGGRVREMRATLRGQQRHPSVWLALIGLVVLLGLGSRRYAELLPRFLASYAGDVLWALAVFLGIGLVLPRASTRQVALLAITVSLLVEISQLYKA